MSDQIFHTQLLHREEVASGTIAFYMAKPADFHYKAGQSIDLTIPNPAETDAEGNTRAYSIASAPHEPELVIATRMRDTAFKRTLAKMPLGSELAIAGPFGSFNLPSNPGASCVFLIGGIGITPVRAMLLDATNAKRTNPLYLFYSNRTPSDAAFLTELRDLSNKNPFLKYIPTMTAVGDTSPWDGETGYITAGMVSKYVDNPQKSLIYLCGPATMVTAMRKVCEELVIPDENIRTEEFSGY